MLCNTFKPFVPGNGDEEGHPHSVWRRWWWHGEKGYSKNINNCVLSWYEAAQPRNQTEFLLNPYVQHWIFHWTETLNVFLPQQVAHSTCGDSEYNLRSRTVVCGSCGLPSDKSSNCSVSSASRSFRSGGVSEGLLPHTYVFSTSTPRKVGTTTQTAHIWYPSKPFLKLKMCLFVFWN